jgi:alkyl hydroperoxide reductase subunit D
MAMNNVYYRFRHLVGQPAYSEKPARLRMNRIARPSTSKADFELVCLALSALNGCEACIQAHETAVLAGSLTEDHVHDAVRIAAVVNAAAVALEVSAVAQPAAAAV